MGFHSFSYGVFSFWVITFTSDVITCIMNSQIPTWAVSFVFSFMSIYVWEEKEYGLCTVQYQLPCPCSLVGIIKGLFS